MLLPTANENAKRKRNRGIKLARNGGLRRHVVMRLFVVGALLPCVLAQTPKQFDVVSIKPSAPDLHNSFLFQNLTGGTVRLAGVPLRMLIMQAYDVKVFQISGGPDWIRTDRWDILAKVEGVDGRLPRDKENAMLQALMADRFQLRMHTETREMPIYALVRDKNEAKLVQSIASEPQFGVGNGSLTAKKSRMDFLTSWLSRSLERTVIDETNLTGEYDFTLEWSPAPGEGGPESIGLPPDELQPRVETNGPSIFTAVQEQLGLRLVSKKGPVKMIVIDSVQKPSAN